MTHPAYPFMAMLKRDFPQLFELASDEEIQAILDNIHTPVMEHEGEKYSVLLALRYLKKTGKLNRESLEEVLTGIWQAEYDRAVDEIIEQHGFMIQGVFPSPGSGGSSFAYTVGLSKKTGFELIITADALQGALQHALNFFAEQALAGEDITQVFASDTLQCDKKDGTVEGLRMQAVLVDAEKARESYIRVTRSESFDVYQVCLADGNNVLPYEEGYDDLGNPNFQPLLPRITLN